MKSLVERAGDVGVLVHIELEAFFPILRLSVVLAGALLLLDPWTVRIGEDARRRTAIDRDHR
jgi:hypothetical protein